MPKKKLINTQPCVSLLKILQRRTVMRHFNVRCPSVGRFPSCENYPDGKCRQPLAMGEKHCIFCFSLCMGRPTDCHTSSSIITHYPWQCKTFSIFFLCSALLFIQIAKGLVKSTTYMQKLHILSVFCAVFSHINSLTHHIV